MNRISPFILNLYIISLINYSFVKVRIGFLSLPISSIIYFFFFFITFPHFFLLLLSFWNHWPCPAATFIMSPRIFSASGSFSLEYFSLGKRTFPTDSSQDSRLLTQFYVMTPPPSQVNISTNRFELLKIFTLNQCYLFESFTFLFDLLFMLWCIKYHERLFAEVIIWLLITLILKDVFPGKLLIIIEYQILTISK